MLVLSLRNRLGIPMRNLDYYFSGYAAYHQSKGNKFMHYFGIPLIVFSILGLFAFVGFNTWVNLGMILWFGSSIFYIRLDWRRGLPFSMLMFILYLASLQVPGTVHGVIFLIGWILQGIGHYKYEKKAPAFLTNVSHLLIGPFWIFCNLVGSSKEKS